MKLESSLPERPGWIFITPGFDLVLLVLALILLTGVVARETLVEVKLPPSEFRGLRMSDEEFVVVTVRQGRQKPIYYVGKERVEEEMLSEALETAAKRKETDKVAVQCDERVNLGVEQKLMDMVTKHEMRYFRVVQPAEEGGQ